MRKFKVLHCKQQMTQRELRHGRTKEGAMYAYEVEHVVKAGEKKLNGEVWYPGAYGHEKIKAGDILELQGRIADKAAANPQFEEVFAEPQVTKKKKRGRPRKVVEDAA